MNLIPSKNVLVRAEGVVPGAGENDYVLRLDNSSLSRFQECNRAGEYYLVKRRDVPKSSPLVAGSALHEGLEYLYKHGVDQTNLVMAKQRASEIYLGETFREDWRTLDLVLGALDGYVSQYQGNDPFKLIEHNGAPLVETAFEVPMGEIYVGRELPYGRDYLLSDNSESDATLYVNKLYTTWTGKIDLGINLSGRLGVLDHKTTSMLGSTFFKQFQLGQQPLGYCFALSKILEQPIAMFMLNVIYWRPPRKNEHIGRTEFSREIFTYNQSHIDEWERDVMELVANYVTCLVKGYFPANRNHCINKYCVCPYHDVCTLPVKQRDTLLNTNLYTDVTWDPTKKD